MKKEDLDEIEAYANKLDAMDGVLVPENEIRTLLACICLLLVDLVKGKGATPPPEKK